MKIVSWNVNGLRSILSKNLLQVVNSLKPDVLCLQETKISLEQVQNEILLPNQALRAEFSCATKKGYSGVASYFFNPAFLPTGESKTNLSVPEFDAEGRFLITTFADICIYNVYFPSGTTGEVRQAAKYRFLDQFFKHLFQLPPEEQKRIVICGDFNICHHDIDIHHPREATKRQLSGFLPDERNWMTRLEDLGFTDCFRHLHPNKHHKYTWWTYRAQAREKNLGWRIDYFFCHHSLIHRLRKTSIHEAILGSDHCPISLEIT